MNAFFALIVWFLGLFNPGATLVNNDNVVKGFTQNSEETAGVHIINVNPRTVVALEDTHFRPNE